MKANIIASAFVRNIAVCPVTRNHPTRVSEAVFRKICLRYQDADDGYCKDICKGQRMPQGLTFIAEGTIEQEMKMKKPVLGKCYLCGARKNVRDVQGQGCCATCEFVWRAANIKPDLVADALVKAQGEEWINRQLPPCPEAGGGIPANVERELVELRVELENMRSDLALARADRDRLQDLLDDAVTEMDAITFTQPVIGKVGQVVTRDSAVLDLALDVIAGQVSGIDVERLRALRL